MIRLLAASVVLCLVSGCYRAVVNTPAPRSGVEGSESGVSWFGLTPVTVRTTECPKGVAKVDSSMPVWGALVYFLTAGIVAPLSIEYQCAGMPQGPAAVPSVE